MNIYLFKISFKHQKSIWRKIEIQENQSLGQFDLIIREAFNYEQHDHLSEFYRGKVWSASGYGDIEPGGRGKGSKKQIIDLNLQPGDKLEYVYDFGDSVINQIELVEIKEEEIGVTYPKIVGRNKPKKIYCERCNNRGVKEIARYDVYLFHDDSFEQLCGSCTNLIEDEDVDISDILY
jgi:hypothetical protein